MLHPLFVCLVIVVVQEPRVVVKEPRVVVQASHGLPLHPSNIFPTPTSSNFQSQSPDIPPQNMNFKHEFIILKFKN